VDKDVGDPGNLFADGGTDGTRDLVGAFNGEVWGYFKVKVDMILEAGFTGEAFFDAESTGDGPGAGFDLRQHFGGGHGVEEFPTGLAEDLEAEDHDEDCDHDAADCVGVGEEVGVVEVEAEGKDGDEAGKDVEPVVGSVGFESGGTKLAGGGFLPAGQGEFDDDRKNDGPDREGLRCGLRLAEMENGLPAEDGSAGDQESADGLAGENFKATVAVRVVFVGWLGRHAEAEPKNDRGDYVASAFDAVGDNGERIRQIPSGNFDDCEEEPGENADSRDVECRLGSGRHAKYSLAGSPVVQSCLTAVKRSGDVSPYWLQ